MCSAFLFKTIIQSNCENKRSTFLNVQHLHMPLHGNTHTHSHTQQNREHFTGRCFFILIKTVNQALCGTIAKEEKGSMHTSRISTTTTATLPTTQQHAIKRGNKIVKHSNSTWNQQWRSQLSVIYENKQKNHNPNLNFYKHDFIFAHLRFSHQQHRNKA